MRRVGHNAAIDGGKDAGRQERPGRGAGLPVKIDAARQRRCDRRNGQRKEEVTKKRARHLRIVLESHG
jgi:hypothetical protein